MAHRLEQLSRKRSRKVVGLISGTSADGVDAALVEVAGSGASTRASLVEFVTLPYPKHVLDWLDSPKRTVASLCEMNFLTGEVFADAVEALAKKAGISLGDIDLIGSHGQTVWHVPRSSGKTASTLQIGEPSVIAERTGAVVVSDFRVRDIAAGGGGAPLVSYVDWLLFREKGKVRAFLNIGGMANVTVVTYALPDVMAFDTGPGNSLIDAAAKHFTNGEARFDRDGGMAAKGNPDGKILSWLMSHPYLALPPPKTTGKGVFGSEFLKGLLRRFGTKKPDDIVATLTLFTAKAIEKAFRDHILARHHVEEVVVSGGGAFNPVLMKHLGELLEPVTLSTLDRYKVPMRAKEAIAFAILANEAVDGIPNNVPSATGARHAVVMGKVVQ